TRADAVGRRRAPVLTRRAPRAPSVAERPAELDAAVRRIAALLRLGTFNVVLTGAGVSTESGLPDFRSKGGLWSGIDPTRVASLSAFQGDPQAFYAFYQTRLAGLACAAPNAAPRAIARREALGAVDLVAMQNVDGPHQQAGTADVVEVQGNLREARCARCGGARRAGRCRGAGRRRGVAPSDRRRGRRGRVIGRTEHAQTLYVKRQLRDGPLER